MEALGQFGRRIDARDVFGRDRDVLLQLLRDLSPDEWERPTAAAPWVVRDVVAHLVVH
ncbi:MAG: maleylpyruvate isomerase N-terminal domain-containing protein [Pseudonocardia sp.]